ncbi:MAG: hypothetical protein ACWGNK_09350 [Desulfobacterales bacterium]
MRRTSIRHLVLLSIGLCAFAAMVPCAAHAQEDLQAVTEAIRNQKRIYIEKAMELTPSEKEAFWWVYANYESGLAKIRAERIKLATDFVARYGKLSDVEALDMLNQKFRIDGDELNFKQSYISNFNQVLPGRKVVRFYQTENRFDTAATSELYRIIPVIQ